MPAYLPAAFVRKMEQLLPVEFPQFVSSYSESSSSQEPIKYLKGETLHIAEERLQCHHSATKSTGYTLVCIDGHAFGWGKWHDGTLKNEYPAGWRWTLA